MRSRLGPARPESDGCECWKFLKHAHNGLLAAHQSYLVDTYFNEAASRTQILRRNVSCETCRNPPASVGFRVPRGAKATSCACPLTG